MRDFWEWDQATNVWSRKADFPGIERNVSFSIGNKGYIIFITEFSNGTKYNEFWEWDQENNIWTKKPDFPGKSTSFSVGYSIRTKGYIGFGGIIDGFPPTNYKDLWEWTKQRICGFRKLTFRGI